MPSEGTAPILEFCKIHPETPARTRGLCYLCYSRWYRGKLVIEGLEPPKKQDTPRGSLKEQGSPSLRKFFSGSPSDEQWPLPDEFHLAEAGVPQEARGGGSAPYRIVRGMMERFLFAPRRVGAIMQRFFERALRDDKVLLEYVKTLLPRQDATPTVQVNISTPLMDMSTKKVYDVTGMEVNDATP
jgi:hypothetical protein